MQPTRARSRCVLLLSLLLLAFPSASSGQAEETEPPAVSDATEECLGCHTLFSPGIVRTWRDSRHARTSLDQALAKPRLERRVSVEPSPEEPGPTQSTSVGCAECHTARADSHADTFEHNGHPVHIVVSPADCAGCHPVERDEYVAQNKMAHAYANLHDNAVYRDLQESVIGLKTVVGASITSKPSSLETQMDTCYGCHGTRVEVTGTREVDTDLGPMEFPQLRGWPNMGVGRVNPDGSLGSCSSCHPRHTFAIRDARQPYTCSQCHLEPDVPAWNVYKESKHGNLFSGNKSAWDFDAVPWQIGRDIQAPTCATCHASLLTDQDGEVIAARTHGYSSRLWVRLFGLIYSHPQPIEPDTTSIRNRDGVPLPVTFSGKPASTYLINPKEQEMRRRKMEAVCRSCHASQWVAGHFDKFHVTLQEVDAMVLASTQLMEQAWSKQLADRKNLFDEPLERVWIRQWLFYANSVRYASAMTGAPDYAAFHNGWWDLSQGLGLLREGIDLREALRP